MAPSHRMSLRGRRRQCVAAGVIALAFAGSLSGCTTPSAANVELRKQVQSLQDQNAKLKTQHAGDEATLKAKDGNPSTMPTPSLAQLDALFTTHGIRFGRLTGGVDLDPAKPGDEGLKIAVIPFDDEQDDLKAAGSITVDAYDLAATDDTHVGHWEFPADQTRALWNGHGLLYEYIVTCPWSAPPKHPDVTIHVTFVDTLTGRSFSKQKVVKVSLGETK